jgi:putative SbcD/Mre11-related phosphoesterase
MKEELKFVTGKPALKIGQAVVVSDLHIGIEYRYRKEGIALPSQSERLFQRLGKLIKRTKAKRVVIIGDVKHKVPGTSFQEEREIPAFFRRLVELAGVEITPGNHDGGIEKLLPEEVKIHPSSGFMLGNTWLCHGHAWPDKTFLDSERIVIGHNHAGIEFRDKLGFRWIEPVWTRSGLDRKGLFLHYKEDSRKRGLPEVVLMPVFNEFAGLIGLNRPLKEIEGYYSEGPGPLFRIMNRDKARIYMLDGTLLGELGKL